MEYDINQNIKETENRINFLLGRFPQEITRDRTAVLSIVPASIYAGIPSQLLTNRPDIKQAELELAAAKLDVKVARAEFSSFWYISWVGIMPSKRLSYLSHQHHYCILAGDLAAPLINRNAIKAEFSSANARQIRRCITMNA
jgi:hypothetical protein